MQSDRDGASAGARPHVGVRRRRRGAASVVMARIALALAVLLSTGSDASSAPVQLPGYTTHAGVDITGA